MNNDIVTELNAMGSPLAQAPQQLPFSVPDGYFANFQEVISDKIVDDGRLLLTPPPYQVSPTYFTTLSGELLQEVKKLDQKAKKRPKLISFNPLKSIKPAIAATLIAVVCIGSYLMFLAPQYHQEALLTGIGPAAIDEYLMPIEPSEAMVNSKHLQELNLNHSEIILYLNATGWD